MALSKAHTSAMPHWNQWSVTNAQKIFTENESESSDIIGNFVPYLIHYVLLTGW